MILFWSRDVRSRQADRVAFRVGGSMMATRLDEVRSATEIAEFRDEKLVMLEPVLERLHDGKDPAAAITDAGWDEVAAGVCESDGGGAGSLSDDPLRPVRRGTSPANARAIAYDSRIPHFVRDDTALCIGALRKSQQ
ncbi:MAG: hypothetical protein Q8K93_27840 [Reyranella sp.]|nr:hypothetical protein [Reyranella sp.]